MKHVLLCNKLFGATVETHKSLILSSEHTMSPINNVPSASLSVSTSLRKCHITSVDIINKLSREQKVLVASVGEY